MKELAVALLLTLATQSVYSFGLFPGHHHDSGGSAPKRRGESILLPIPEPKTYLFMLIGVGAVAWIIRTKNKK